MAAIETVAVIGAGTMGNGIAHVAARSGFKVILYDIDQRLLDHAVSTIAKNLDREVAKSKISADDKSSALSRIVPTVQNSALAEADFVIEAVIENFETKSKVFQVMDEIGRPSVILASNTSSISITKIASKTKRPDKVIGMHFMNPVPMMTLVEIVRGLATSDETYETTKQIAESLGKTPVQVNDFPGFVSNGVLMPMINEGYLLRNGGRRHDRSSRFHHEAWYEPSDGAVGARGSDWPGCVPRHHGRFVFRLRGFKISAVPSFAQNGGCRPCG